MISLLTLAKKGEHILRSNSPAILTALGVSGSLTTAYLAGKASWRASRKLGEESAYLSFKEKVEIVWPLYIPAACSGVLTVGCIVGSNRISSKRAAAAYSVLSISEKAFEEYREKVIEKFGENKERAVRDEIAQDRINNHPPGNVIVTGGGSVLCCELFSGRYFSSDMESLRKAENDVNAKLLNHMYASLDDFYYIVGLPQTSQSGYIGWESDKLMKLEFSTVFSEDNKPCLAFDYNYTKPFK